eukprot:756963-Hanusia_phi.AAC.4
MVFNNEELFSSCSGRSLPGYELTKETYEQVWDSLTRWIRATFESKNQVRGPRMPPGAADSVKQGSEHPTLRKDHLGWGETWSQEEAVELGRRASAESVGVARPHVCISEYFIHQYGIRYILALVFSRSQVKYSYRKPAELPEAKIDLVSAGDQLLREPDERRHCHCTQSLNARGLPQ